MKMSPFCRYPPFLECFACFSCCVHLTDTTAFTCALVVQGRNIGSILPIKLIMHHFWIRKLVSHCQVWLSPGYMFKTTPTNKIFNSFEAIEWCESPTIVTFLRGYFQEFGTLIIPAAHLPLPNFEIALRSTVLCSVHGGIIFTADGRGFTSVKHVKLISTEKYS